ARIRAAWTAPGAPAGADLLIESAPPPLGPEHGPDVVALAAGQDASAGPARAAAPAVLAVSAGAAGPAEPNAQGDVLALWRSDIGDLLTRRMEAPAVGALIEALTREGLITLIQAAALGCDGASVMLWRLAPSAAAALAAESAEALAAALLTAARHVLDSAEAVLARAQMGDDVYGTLIQHMSELTGEAP
ncbi:MAG: hypothetical protein LBT54_07195, partial [Bifidobacteriaceae bacterium]|nr:hypothetical protein [Bifidobacteriaceae bacterium]